MKLKIYTQAHFCPPCLAAPFVLVLPFAECVVETINFSFCFKKPDLIRRSAPEDGKLLLRPKQFLFCRMQPSHDAARPAVRMRVVPRHQPWLEAPRKGDACFCFQSTHALAADVGSHSKAMLLPDLPRFGPRKALGCCAHYSEASYFHHILHKAIGACQF